MKTYTLDQIKEIRILGRTTGNRNPLALFWTGSGIECNIKASELWIEVEADYDLHEPWMSIIINEAQIARQMLTKGRYWICVFRNMDKEKTKAVRIVKDVQAMGDDLAHMFKIHAIKTDGTFEEPPKRDMCLEVIGDSITSGEGGVGALEDMDWISMFFSAEVNYARILANKLNADLRIISQSGWGICNGWNNDPNSALPRHYENVCSVMKGESSRELGAAAPNDFSSWQPDVVVINLGTNDEGSFHADPWLDTDTGVEYKMRIEEDGSLNKEDLNKLYNAVIEFMTVIRKNNPKALIIWCYGLFGKELTHTISTAVEAYSRENNDKKALFHELAGITEDGYGSRSHPGKKAHEAMAAELEEEIKKNI